MRQYLQLAIAIVFEVLGTTMMKLSNGFTDPLFTTLTLASYVVAFGSLTFALKKLPLGLAYGIWGGLGTAATAAIGIAFFGDPFGWGTCVGIALVVGGIVLLNQGSVDAAKEAEQAA